MIDNKKDKMVPHDEANMGLKVLVVGVVQMKNCPTYILTHLEYS